MVVCIAIPLATLIFPPSLLIVADMVTGRGYLDVNRISGYIPGKLVFFLMQVRREALESPAWGFR